MEDMTRNFRDENIVRLYKKAFSKPLENGIKNEIERLVLIGTKILNCDKASLKVGVDIDRLYDELRYFQLYQERTNLYFLNFFLPLILSTRNFYSIKDVYIDLVEKMTTFYKQKDKKIDYILDLFIYDIVIRKMIEGNNELYSLLEIIRDEIISFHIDIQEKGEKIFFHTKKIRYIEEIHKYIDDEDYIGSIVIFRILRNAFLDQKNDGLYDVGMVCVYNTISSNYDYEDNFISLMADFLLKIRYYKISIGKYNRLDEVFNFSNTRVGDKFRDPILNDVLIEGIEIDRNKLIKTVSISSRTGRYLFRYKV